MRVAKYALDENGEVVLCAELTIRGGLIFSSLRRVLSEARANLSCSRCPCPRMRTTRMASTTSSIRSPSA